MADEQQQQRPQQHPSQQQQQQQPSPQQMQQHLKSVKEAGGGGSMAGGAAAGGPPRKTSIHEMRNQDYVSRLMAATPPYLYSAAIGPSNFFFSDLLRSLVQTRNNENARNLQLQQSALTRRPRKRSWSQHRPYFEHLRERKECEEKLQQQQQQHQQQVAAAAHIAPMLNAAAAAAAAAGAGAEKPLELTNKPFFPLSAATAAAAAAKYRKVDLEPTKELALKPATIGSPSGGATDTTLQSTPPAASLPPQDLVLPPPPPVWYPPLYPPYGIDPLHFFIDLRVSGHIYDRKKENVSPLTASTENSGGGTSAACLDGDPSNAVATGAAATPSAGGLIMPPSKHRHGSAFTVPVPRSNELKAVATTPTLPLHNAADAINLTSAAMASKFEHYAKYYDLGEAKENNQPLSKFGSAHLLQQLPRLYSQFAARDLIGSNAATSADGDTKSEQDADGDGDSDGRGSVDDCEREGRDGTRDRDIDVEIVDSIKYRTDGESSRCTSPDEASITHID